MAFVPPFDPLQLHVHPIPVSVTVVGSPVEQRTVVGEALVSRLFAVPQIQLTGELVTVSVFATISAQAHHAGVISVVPAVSVVIVVLDTVATLVFELV